VLIAVIAMYPIGLTKTMLPTLKAEALVTLATAVELTAGMVRDADKVV
jgi:hypothetical protein